VSTGQFPVPTGQYPVPEFAPPPELSAPAAGAIGFVLRLGKALHQSGYPAHLLERALTLVARRLGLEAQFFSTPTSIFAAFGVADRQQTTMTRVEPGEVNLARLSRLDGVMRDVIGGRATALQGSARVEHLLAAPGPYPAWLTVLAFGLASSAVAVLLGGGRLEVAIAALLGLVTGGIGVVTGRSRTAQAIFEPTAAFAVALLAALAEGIVGPYATGIATLAGLVAPSGWRSPRRSPRSASICRRPPRPSRCRRGRRTSPSRWPRSRSACCSRPSPATRGGSSSPAP